MNIQLEDIFLKCLVYSISVKIQKNRTEKILDLLKAADPVDQMVQLTADEN